MPKIVDASEQRAQIRTAARRAFAKRGVTGTGLEHVARSAGMGRSTLYHYYRDKDALLRDLVRETLEQEAALFRACLRQDKPALERIRELVEASVALFDEWASLGRMLLDLRLRDTARFRRYLREIRAELASAIREGQEGGELRADLDPELAASALAGALDGLLFQYFVDRAAFPDRDAVARQLVQIAERTLLP